MHDEPLTCPFTVVIDTREQLGYSFAGLRADRVQKSRPLAISTVRATLTSGDYSIVGHESSIAVERKSLHDAFNTLGQNRGRFERELQRLNELQFAAVVVESNWYSMLTDPPAPSKLNPKTVFRSVIAWQQRYTRVHWWFMDNRRLAEVATFRILDRFWRERQRKRSADAATEERWLESLTV
jgi:ERCC4-type nuclease